MPFPARTASIINAPYRCDQPRPCPASNPILDPNGEMLASRGRATVLEFGKAHPVLPSYRDGMATGSKWCFHPQDKERMSRPRRMISSAGNEVGWSSVSASPKRILPMPLAMHRQPPRDAARAACPPAGELQLPVVMECTRITRSGCSPQRDRRPWPSAPSYYGRGRKSDLFSIA